MLLSISGWEFWPNRPNLTYSAKVLMVWLSSHPVLGIVCSEHIWISLLCRTKWWFIQMSKYFQALLPSLDQGREGDKTPKLHFCFLKASKLFQPVVMGKLLSSLHQSINWRWNKSLSLSEPLLLALPRTVPYTQEYLVLEIFGSLFEFTAKGLYAKSHSSSSWRDMAFFSDPS